VSDIVLQKHRLDSFYIVSQLPNHYNLKERILISIDKFKQGNLHNIDSFYSDRITKLDWDNSKDLTREWTLLIYDTINSYFSLTAKNMGYQSSVIHDIWFQQYYNMDTHGWHTHGNNFTAVYYLELNELSPKTELIDPFSLNKKIIPNVKEGDIIIFPSYVIHRAPIIENNIRKTIISCNLDFIDPHPDILSKLNSL
jgi:hypothetical protein